MLMFMSGFLILFSLIIFGAYTAVTENKISMIDRARLFFFKRKLSLYLNRMESTLRGVNKKIEKIKTEINLIPDNPDFNVLKEGRIQLLKEFELSKELKIQKIVGEMKEGLPVLLIVRKNHKKVILKNKDLIDIYKNYIETKNKKNLKILNLEELTYVLMSFENRVNENEDKVFMRKHLKEIFIALFENKNLSENVSIIVDYLLKKEIVQN